MQARGEVMESEACASATDRGGNAAPARAAGPASDDLRAARWLDDSLSIELDGVALKLTRAQALRIVALYGVPA